MADWRDSVSTSAPTAATPPSTGGNWRSQVVAAVPNDPDAAPANNLVKNSPGFSEAQNPFQAFMAGLHMSASVIPFSRPSMELPSNAGFFSKLAFGLGQGIGDAPVNIAGAVGGGAAGGAGGATVPGFGETGSSEAVGGVVGAGVGIMALPQAVRETMMDYYADKDSGVVTWRDLAHQIAHSAWNVAKQGAIGAIAGPIAGKIGGVAESVGASPFVKNAASVLGFSSAATGAQAALDQKAPDAQDFAIGTITALTLAGAGHLSDGKFVPSDAGTRVQSNQENIYRQSGVPPWQQTAAAKSDPVLNNELMAQDVNGDPVATKFNATRPEEPEPFKTSPSKIADEHASEMSEIHAQATTAAHVETLLPQIRSLENSGDEAISPKGAVGRYQVMPGTARQYGFDPVKLTDPAYNEQVARHVLTDLSRRFHGDTEAVLVAYNAGPGRAMRFLRDGRDTTELPYETQKYLAHAGFGGRGGEPPEPPPPVEEPPAGDKGPDFSALNTDSRLSRFQDAIGEQPERPTTGLSGVMRQWVSELESARGIDRTMAKEGLLDPSKDLSTEDMFRMTYGSDDRVTHFLTQGPVDPIDFSAKEGPSMVDILKKVGADGGSIDEFNLYRVAARTVEKAQQGIDTGIFKGGLAEAGANLQDPRLQKYKAANEDMQKWKAAGLEYGRDSGLWNQARMDAMQAANTSHVSLRRIMGDDEAFNMGKTKGKNFKANNPLKKMEGSERQIVEPLTADIDNMRQIVRMADRNRAIGHVLGSQERVDLLGLTKLPAPEIKAMLAEPGSSQFKPYSMSPEEQAAFQPFAIESNKGANTGNRFTFYNKGVPEVWEARDPNVAALMRGADSPGEADIVSKVLSLPAKLQRTGIMASPDFAFRVPLRHQLTAWVLDPLHPPPYITAIRGLMDMWGKGDAFHELMRQGGANASIIELDKSVIKEDMQKLMEETGASSRVWNAVKHPLHFAQLITEHLTAASRVGYYMRAKEQGIAPLKAAMLGRKAYLDYSERATGVVANWMAKQVPFFKSAMLGMKQGGEAVSDRPLQTLTYAGLGLVVPQIALYALNHGADKFLDPKDRYSSLPQWERDQYFITPPINGVRLKLARPYVIGPAVGVPIERVLERMFEDDPHSFDGMMQSIASDITPGAIPQAMKPALEQITNHNFFTGRPLVSDSLREATSDLQYVDNTSEVAKRISSLLGSHQGLGIANVSPVVLDNYVEEWGGTVGMTVLHALDTPLGHQNGPMDVSDLPFIRAFLARNPRMGTKQIDDFYTDAQKFSALNRDVSMEVKAGKEDQAIADKGEVGRKAVLTARIEHALNVQRTALHALNTNKKLNVDEKRQLSERIYNDAWQMARFGSSILHDKPVAEDAAKAASDQAEQDVQQAVGDQ